MRDDSSRTIHLPARPAVPGRRPARRAEPPTAGRRRAARSATALTTLLLALPTALSAQSFERVGTRALGFAGAFVAVADDATAPFWNPAGLWTGSWVDARVDGGVMRAEAVSAPSGGNLPTSEHKSFLYIGLVVPSLGVSYLRSERTDVGGPGGPAVAAPADRDNDRSRRVPLTSLSTEHVGITLVQSLSDWLAAGTTLRAVRGDAARGAGDPGEGLPRLEESATSLPGQIGYAVDADVGAMVAFPWGRAGVVVRNVRAAAFDPADGGEPLRLARQARVGIALTPGRPTAPTVSREPGSWTIAVDADLTRTVRPAGSWRTVAIGAERWMAGGRLGVRGGIRGSTTGAWRPVAAGGLSLVVRDHLIVEAQGTGGHRSGDRGWSVAGRATF